MVIEVFVSNAGPHWINAERSTQGVYVRLGSTILPSIKRDKQLESRLESKLAARVILILQNEEIGKLQIVRALGHETVSGELNKQIKQLLKLGIIEMTIPYIPNSRLQKYRLTLNGSELIHESQH